MNVMQLRILKDNIHPCHSVSTLLPSAKRYRSFSQLKVQRRIAFPCHKTKLCRERGVTQKDRWGIQECENHNWSDWMDNWMQVNAVFVLLQVGMAQVTKNTNWDLCTVCVLEHDAREECEMLFTSHLWACPSVWPCEKWRKGLAHREKKRASESLDSFLFKSSKSPHLIWNDNGEYEDSC